MTIEFARTYLNNLSTQEALMFKGQDIELKKFSDIDLNDPFFDSLKESYNGFDQWFERKSDETAYIMSNMDGVQAFLYLKIELGAVTDITPPLNTNICLKIGTFKINAHGTRLGERFVKKIFDHAIVNNINHIYVTVFEKHLPLIHILTKYGFEKYGVKNTSSGQELVFLKDFNRQTGNHFCDYPVANAQTNNKWLLAIRPEWHTRLFPDSILKTENSSIINDISHTNSIHKVYISWARNIGNVNPGDLIIIYRMKEDGERAWFRSVATSICVVDEIESVNSFETPTRFNKFASAHSVFSEKELADIYRRQKGYAIKMTYNIALPKRLNMRALVEEVGLDREEYWGFKRVSNDQFSKLIEIARVPSCSVILP